MRTFLISLLLLVGSFGVPVSAQTCPQGQVPTNVYSPTDYTCSTPTGTGVNTGTTLINPLNGGGTLEGFLTSILSFVIRIGAIVVVLMLVYVGYLFVVARGKPGEIETAKKALLWTVVGALILLGAQAISIAIQQTVSALSVGR